MSIMLWQQALEIPEIKGQGSHVMLYLAIRANDDGDVWCSSKEVVRQLGINKDTFFRKIKELEELGFLQRRSRTAPGGNNSYRITLPAKAEVHEIDALKTGQGPSVKTDKVGAKAYPESRTNLSGKPDYPESGTCPKTRMTHVPKTGQAISEKPDNISTIHTDKLLVVKATTTEATPGWFNKFFDDFWKAYPARRKRSISKDEMRVQFWEYIHYQEDEIFTSPEEPTDPEEIANQMLKALERHKKTDDWTKEDGRFVPGMPKFLTNHYWSKEQMPRPKKHMVNELWDTCEKDPLYDADWWETRTTDSSEEDPFFSELWSLYPVKLGTEEAAAELAKLLADASDPKAFKAEVIAGVKNGLASEEWWDDGRNDHFMAPTPMDFVSNQLWKDSLTPRSSHSQAASGQPLA